MSLIVRGMITPGMMKNGIDNRGMEASERLEPDAVVDIRDLESRLRDAGCSRSYAKTLVARYKILEGLDTDAEQRDAAYCDTFIQRDAESDTESDPFSELMNRYEKLQTQ